MWPEASSISRNKNNLACVYLVLIVASKWRIFYELRGCTSPTGVTRISNHLLSTRHTSDGSERTRTGTCGLKRSRKSRDQPGPEDRSDRCVAAVHVSLHAACVYVCVHWTEAREHPGSLVRPDSGLAPDSECFWSCSISLYRHAAELCRSKRSSSDTDEGWRSRRWQMWKRSAVEGAGTDLSGFDGSLKHCSERSAVIGLTIPPCSPVP